MVRTLSGELNGLPDPLELARVEHPFELAVRPPGSKSLTNRALLLAGLAAGESVLRGALTDAEDARRMMEGLEALGAEVRESPGEVRVRGVGGAWRVGAGVRLNLGNAGTATRFLAAAAILADGPVEIDGSARMRERPIGELIDALRGLGARVEYLGRAGYPPLRVWPLSERGGAVVRLGRTMSSQFVSGLLMAGAMRDGGLRVEFSEEATSPSYVEMTLVLLGRLGARVQGGVGEGWMRVDGPVRAFELDVEPDASGAVNFWAAAAVVPGSRARVLGLDSGSLQGDAGFVEVLERMGAEVERGEGWIGVRGAGLRGVEADLARMPDAAMTLAAVACFAEGPTAMRGLRTLRVKETDRIEAMRAEFTKLGARVEVDGDEGVVVHPIAGVGGVGGAGGGAVTVRTYDDHRMAMSLAVAALRRGGVRIADPACVAKTYPGFWRDLAGVYAGSA